jgi:glycosyltransferase involved in cell wall biosynthesis
MFHVLMPAYNAGRYIAEAIESVRAQTVGDWQLLVIDDGSKDDTLAVAQTIAAKDSRVRVITQSNAGIAPTLNRGLEMLEGAEWVFLMHADDVMMPSRIERQAAFVAANPDLAVASSLVYYINGAGDTIGHGRSPFTDPKAVEAAVKRAEMIAFNHPACVLRRQAVLDAGGYRQAFWPAEDCDLWGRIVERGHRVAVQDEFLLKYRIHGSSASISRARLMQQKTIWLENCIVARRKGDAEPTWEEFQAQRKRVPFFTRMNHNRQELGRTFYQAAIHHIATRQYGKLVPKLIAAAVLEPGLVLSRVLPRILPQFLFPRPRYSGGEG